MKNDVKANSFDIKTRSQQYEEIQDLATTLYSNYYMEHGIILSLSPMKLDFPGAWTVQMISHMKLTS